MFNTPTLGLFNAGLETFWSDTIYLLFLGIICTAIAFVVSVSIMQKISPFTVSISINMEPIYAIILALIIFGEEERMSTGFYFGTALIMITIFGNGLIKQRNKRR